MSEKEIHNAQTGEIVRRELTADELAQAQLDKNEDDLFVEQQYGKQ